MQHRHGQSGLSELSAVGTGETKVWTLSVNALINLNGQGGVGIYKGVVKFMTLVTFRHTHAKVVHLSSFAFDYVCRKIDCEAFMCATMGCVGVLDSEGPA